MKNSIPPGREGNEVTHGVMIFTPGWYPDLKIET